MATINIRRDVKDSFYRYKMPRLISKIEGKGNGIKTVVPNMPEIARALARPPMYPTKFFGCELGAQVKCDAVNDRYIVNGAHDAERLQQLLDVFIAKFVLCSACQNPETDLVVGKDQVIWRVCKACGQRGMVDMKHKLVTYILKNPPNGSNGKKEKKSKKTPAVAVATIPTTPLDGESPSMSAGGQSEDEDFLTRRINAEAANLGDIQSAFTDSLEESAAATTARLDGLTDSVKKLVVAGDEEDDDEEGGDQGSNKYEAFGEWVVKNMKSASNDEIWAHAESLGVAGKHKALHVLVQTALDAGFAKQIPERGALLLKFGTSEKHQRAVLGGIERLVGQTHPELMPKVAVILQMLYLADVIEEEPAVKWGSRASKKYVDRETSKAVKDKAQPFFVWLAEAEEESEDEDE